MLPYSQGYLYKWAQRAKKQAFKISKSIEEEHQISNKERMYYNLPIKKRIDKSILKKVLDSLFKTTSGFKIREVGQNNIDTTFLKANVEVV